MLAELRVVACCNIVGMDVLGYEDRENGSWSRYVSSAPSYCLHVLTFVSPNSSDTIAVIAEVSECPNGTSRKLMSAVLGSAVDAFRVTAITSGLVKGRPVRIY